MTLIAILMVHKLVYELSIYSGIYMGRDEIIFHVDVTGSANISVMLSNDITQTKHVCISFKIIRGLEVG